MKKIVIVRKSTDPAQATSLARQYIPPKQPTLKKEYPKSPEELDHTPLTIGQYKGQTPSQIAEHDPAYLVWLAERKSERIASDLLINDCKKEMN
jgi:hypothetical protein